MRKIYLILFLFILTVSCYQEEEIKVSQEGEPFYVLPQGNHDYDEDIVGWFENYGFYVLYQFKESDAYWNNQDYEEWNGLFTGHCKVKQAEETYTGKLVQWFGERVLAIYPDDLRKQAMPLKVLLCSELWNVENVYKGIDPDTKEAYYEQVYHNQWGKSGYDYIAVNGASSVMDTMTIRSQRQWMQEVNAGVLARIGGKQLIPVDDEFFEISDYSKTNIYGLNLFKNGMLNYLAARIPESSAKLADYQAYVQMLSYSLEYLEGNPPVSVDNNFPSLAGVLSPEREGHELIRRKYEIMVDCAKRVGIDVEKLQHPLK